MQYSRSGALLQYFLSLVGLILPTAFFTFYLTTTWFMRLYAERPLSEANPCFMIVGMIIGIVAIAKLSLDYLFKAAKKLRNIDCQKSQPLTEKFDSEWATKQQVYSHLENARESINQLIVWSAILAMITLTINSDMPFNVSSVLYVFLGGLSFYLLAAETWKEIQQSKILRTAKVTFSQFPYYTGTHVTLTWTPDTAIPEIESAEIKLRCITKMDDKAYEVWSETYEIPRTAIPEANTPLPLSFHPPQDTPPLSQNPKSKSPGNSSLSSNEKV